MNAQLQPSGGMVFTQPLLVDYVYVCHHMREDEREQFVALGTGEPFDAEEAAISLAASPGPRWALILDDTPLVIGGYFEIRPGVWQDWMAGTPLAWGRHWRSITRYSRKVMAHMLANGAHRLQTVALASRTEARKWYRVLGLEYEGLLRGYGAGGEDAVIYARMKEGSNGHQR